MPRSHPSARSLPRVLGVPSGVLLEPLSRAEVSRRIGPWWDLLGGMAPPGEALCIAWPNHEALWPARLGEWAVARGRLVLASREPAGRGSHSLRGTGMDSGSLGVRGLTGGVGAGGDAGDRSGAMSWVGYGRTAGPPEAQLGDRGRG